MTHTPYEKACIALTKKFLKKYFPDYTLEDTDSVWFVANDVAGVFYVCDMFFTISDMHEYMKYGYTTEQICEHYWIEHESKYMNHTCIRDYLKLKEAGVV